MLLPTLWIGFAVQDPNTNYAVFAAIALLCGLGAGNFSSSMAHISFLYPKRLQGTALGANAGVGNLGVGLAQLIAPLAMYGGALLVMGGSAQTREVAGAVVPVWVQNAGFIWVPLIVLSVIAAWFGMDNIASVRAGFAEQVAILRNKQQWRMSWLYLGTFGSFIGLAAGFRCWSTPSSRRSTRSASRLSARCSARWCARSAAGSPTARAGADHRRRLRRDDDRAACSGILPSRCGRRGQPDGLRAGVHRTVRRSGRGQRLDVPHDPDHLSRAASARSRTQATRMRWRRPAASAPPKAPRHWDSVRPSRRSAWPSSLSPMARRST